MRSEDDCRCDRCDRRTNGRRLCYDCWADREAGRYAERRQTESPAHPTHPKGPETAAHPAHTANKEDGR